MDRYPSPTAAPAKPRHLTTRRGFLAAASLGTLSLYGAWALLGAAPRLGHGGADAHAAHGAATDPAEHDGHGTAASGPTQDAFRRETDAFIARHQLPDGSVLPQHFAPEAHGHDRGAHGSGNAPTAGPTPVYLAAARFSFEPAVLRLATDATYRFRMMAVDASHGAAIQLGGGSRIVRLRRGVLVERDITFTRPGEYLVYCTVFCGLGHDRMTGRIIVARGAP